MQLRQRHECSLKLTQGQRGQGKTNSVKVEYQDEEPLFIVDIRNEYRHVPAIRTYKDTLLWAMGGAKPLGKKHQWRFCFYNRPDYVRLFNLFNNFTKCTIIIDEADALFTDRKFENGLINLFLGSRNNDIHLVFNTKRPFLIPIMVRSQIDEWVIFRTEEKRDIDYLEDRLRTEFPKDTFKLGKGEAIVIKSGHKPQLRQFPMWKGD